MLTVYSDKDRLYTIRTATVRSRTNTVATTKLQQVYSRHLQHCQSFRRCGYPEPNSAHRTSPWSALASDCGSAGCHVGPLAGALACRASGGGTCIRSSLANLQTTDKHQVYVDLSSWLDPNLHSTDHLQYQLHMHDTVSDPCCGGSGLANWTNVDYTRTKH